MTRADICIVGAGIAGAGLAAALGDRARVLLLEGESQPGYHTTGRSAAFYSEVYGGPAVQPLTTASKPFFLNPPAGFADVPLVRPRGCLHIAEAADRRLLAEMDADFAAAGVALRTCDRTALETMLPDLSPAFVAARQEPGCRDIDVAALHGGFLRVARRAGVELVCGAAVRAVERRRDGWSIATAAGTFSAAILVNAAGAWADPLARLAGVAPIGLQPLRRTVVQVATDPPAPADLPLVIDAAGRFYFKPEAGGRFWLSPHDETPQEPGDAVADEYDVALAIDRFERAMGWRVLRVERAWAGLRTFAPDRAPVYGHDPQAPGFFWCAGQGGFGIQTAPAAARTAAALLLGIEPPAGIDPDRYRPRR